MAPRRTRPAPRPGRAARLPRDQRVAEILRAARAAFCERGYERAAVAEIAARLGVVEGTVFKYFPTKRELLNRVIENWYEELFGDYSRDLAGVDGARPRFRYLVWRHLRTLRDAPQMCRLIFSEVRSQPDYLDSVLHGMNQRYTGLLIDVVRDGMRSGEFRAGLPLPLVRDMVFGSIEHHAWKFLYGHGRLEVERLADQITALLCDGMQQRDEAAALARQTRSLARLGERVERLLATRAPARGPR